MDTRQPLAITLVFAFSGLLPLFSQDNTLVLHDATPVRMRMNRSLSSADATIGETVDFEVIDEIKIGDTVVIARGGTAIATVTEAQSKRRMGRGGKLDVNIDYARTVNGDKIALRAVKEMKGGGHTGAMTGAIVATSLLFWPAAPFFLFIHGKDIAIPKGTEITAYTTGEIRLDPIKLTAKQVAPTSAAPEVMAPAEISARELPAATSPTPAASANPSLALALAPVSPRPAAPVPASYAPTPALPAAPVAPIPAAANGSPSTPKLNELTNTRRLQSDEDTPAVVTLPGSKIRPKLVNADIIALKQAGFGDNLIISKIRASGANYTLNIKDLLELKKANISEPVISAMIEASIP
jgi:hypothetical protein